VLLGIAIKRESGFDKIIGHVSYDSTAIEGREKAVGKAKKESTQNNKRGRKRKDGEQEEKEQTRLELQPHRSLAENLAGLPSWCDVGTKANSKGYLETWRGYKLHLGVVDGGIPICAVLTSASLHDSQAMIPIAVFAFVVHLRRAKPACEQRAAMICKQILA
jgi:hypothetical protein